MPDRADHLLVFDGDCLFCRTRIERQNSALPLVPEAPPRQWLDLDAFRLTCEGVDRSAWYVKRSRHDAGHLPFSAVPRARPRFGFRLAGQLLATWARASGAAYALIARFRHVLPCVTPTYALPPS